MAYQKGLVATLAELEDFYRGKEAGDVIELMNQTNDVLDDVQWMECNQSEGHKTRIRTGLPEVYWRRLYRGTPPSKSQWTQVLEPCGMLEARMELDAAECELYGDKANAFRLSEALAFAEAMRQKVASTIFYGNAGINPDEFNGLAMRYPAKNAPNVVNAGGTKGGMTSAYLVCWGANTCHGIYPKGTAAGLEHRDLGEQTVQDANGYKFEALVDKHVWRCGLTVRDWRAVVRIANIPTANLNLRQGETGFVDLQALTVQAKNMMPESMRSRAIWYCNADLMTALELQSTDKGSVHLTYGQYFGSNAVPSLHGRPVRQCDAILSTEAVI